MGETTLKIGGLLEVAEAQQQAITAQLEQLKHQTAALAQATAQVNAAREQAIIPFLQIILYNYLIFNFIIN